MTAADAADCIRFGRFELQPRERRLLADGIPVAIGPRAFDLLVALAQRSGRLVTKDELFEQVWPGVVVEENTLQAHVSSLRKILGREAVATVSGRGYRFTLQPGIEVPADTPPPRHNLPQHLTSFIGREREIVQLRQMLATVRLLTLTGAGGCGKTRLALQVACELLPAYRDGIWLVELSALTDPGLVPQALAGVVGVKEQSGKTLTQSLVDHLVSQRALIVLDNAEHLLAGCTQLADAVLRACGEVTLLATSREPLGIAGELTYRVPSLGVPDPALDVTPQHILRCDSARLFVERARLQRPHFTVTNENAPALASICRQLDGIPLAIELAAPRLRSMSVEEVDRRLDRLFSLLTGGSRTALPRQRTLRSLIDWSYDLLSDTEKALLRRLSVFSGGWTLEAAEHVCVDDGIGTDAMLDLLASLCDKSLLVADEHDGATRYRLLETVRRYAREWLHQRGEEMHWLDRHLAYFVALAEEAEPSLNGGRDQQAWLGRIEMEHDNVRSALARSGTRPAEAVSGLRLAAALWRFWWMRGYLREGRTWLESMLAAVPACDAPAVRAKAFNGAGVLSWLQGDFSAARSYHEASLGLRRELDDRRGIAASLNNLAILDSDQGDHAVARTRHEESLSIWRGLGEKRGVANTLSNLANLARDAGDLREARVLHEECLATRRELGDRHGIATSLLNLAVVARDQGDYAGAVALGEESLAISRDMQERRNIAASLGHLGVVACERDDFGSGRTLLLESVAVCRAIGDRYVLAESLQGVAYAFAHDRPARAATIFGAAERLREAIGSPRKPKDIPRHQRQVAAARAALGDDAAFDRAWHEGCAMDLDASVRYALATAEACPQSAEQPAVLLSPGATPPSA
jgi:non-specific serine/threonine protein kinase